MQALKVTGGKVLRGSITPQGSKNEALMVMCAALLAVGKTTIHNIPNILDTKTLMEVFRVLGVKITQLEKNSWEFDTSTINSGLMNTGEYLKEFKKIRGSIMVAAPLLAKYGEVIIYKPGGDKIGRRRIDVHLDGLEELGATISFDNQNFSYTLKAKQGLKGTHIILEEASVTGTANLIMAASLASGVTTIYNAACEPHIQELCKMLTSMGAKIEGVGSNFLRIEGVKELRPTQHTVKADMLEVGSLIALAAMTTSEIRIKNSGVCHLTPVLNNFKKIGIEMDTAGDDLMVRGEKNYSVKSNVCKDLITIADAPWPGFPADLISVILVAATQANGNVLIHQKMYESRLFFVDQLIDMGAQIILCDPHRAAVIGLNKSFPLRATSMSSPDIRAGNALLIAALSAEGTSTIYNADLIDRGYENIDGKLRALGAEIERV